MNANEKLEYFDSICVAYENKDKKWINQLLTKACRLNIDAREGLKKKVTEGRKENKTLKMYKQAIAHWGEKEQLKKAIEELTELKDEIQDWLDGKGDEDRIVEELADAINMIEQIKLMFGLHTRKVFAVGREKMKRTIKMIEKEKKEQLNIKL